jgi:hypothetical protein
MAAARRRPLTICLPLAVLGTAAVFLFAAADGKSTAGPSRASSPVFRGRVPGLKMSVYLFEGTVGFDAHARVSCADGSEHWQLLIEGGRGGHADAGGRFHHAEYEAAQAGERPPSTDRVTLEQVEEGLVYGFPAGLRQIKGRVLPNSVVGWIRFWEGPGTLPGTLHSKCGTGSPEGEWMKFVVPRVKGAAPHYGHRSRASDAAAPG